MAEEGTLGLKRASHAGDDDDVPSKEELQRRMEEARESITQTVTEIKETVTNQYNSVKETLDWRTHFRKRPIAFSVGALSVGFLVGYGLAGQIKGQGRRREGYPSYEETDLYERTGARPSRYEDEEEAVRHSAFHGHSYAAQPITDGTSEAAADYERSSIDEAVEEGAGDYSPPRGGEYTYDAPRASAEEQDAPQKPGLFQRFKGTSAYDRLQTEVASLGDRFIEELSNTAHNVVLPALFAKIKELFGVDLSGKKSQGGQAQTAQTAQTGTGTKADTASTQAASAQAAGASASLASASRGSSSAYATSENRGYGAKDAGTTSNRSGGDSILDLDR
jgi:hypothetical protein